MVAGIILHHHADLPVLAPWLLSLRYLDRQVRAHQPWLPFRAIHYMESRLGRTSVVFEYGAGGSTLWLAKRVHRVVAVEHDAAWHARIVQELANAGLQNGTLVLRPAQPWAPSVSPEQRSDYSSLSTPGSFEQYARAVEAFEDEAFDLVLVDGKARSACLRHAARKVRVGGLLALDDSEQERYRVDVERFAGWPHRVFSGLRPGSLERSRTTFWERTSDSL